jgi:hypothetical protein
MAQIEKTPIAETNNHTATIFVMMFNFGLGFMEACRIVIASSILIAEPVSASLARFSHTFLNR